MSTPFRLTLLPGVIPENEQDHSFALSRTLDLIGQLVDDFHSALTLFDRLEAEYAQLMGSIRERPFPRVIGDDEKRQMRQLSNWMQVCVRDGAISIWNIAEAIAGMQKALGLCVFIRAHVDAVRRREAVKMFRTAFPHAAAVRHAITHCAQISKDGVATKGHALKSDLREQHLNIAAGNFITFHGRQFRTTWDGEVVGYELGPEALANLLAFRDALYKVFEPVEVQIWKQWEQSRTAPVGNAVSVEPKS
jgi:hypothetical protein